MSETAIPEDIIDAAENVWIALEDADGIRECVLTIAVAILAERQAERERCNTIVRDAFGKNASVDALVALAKCEAIVASYSKS